MGQINRDWVLVLRHSIKTTVTCFTSLQNILSNICHLLDPTKDLEGRKQADDKDGCSIVVIILGSLVAVLSAALLILGVCFLSWRKKQRKGNLLSRLYNMSDVSRVLLISALRLFLENVSFVFVFCFFSFFFKCLLES